MKNNLLWDRFLPGWLNSRQEQLLGSGYTVESSYIFMVILYKRIKTGVTENSKWERMSFYRDNYLF